MLREQYDWEHEYLITPHEYPISDNNAHSTYDQFMTLRDTMVYSNKFYGNNAWRGLIIWMKTDGNPTNTIEIWQPNITTLRFEPNGTVNPETQWKYTSTWWHQWISCEINTSGRYILQHKEQFVNIPSSITRIHTFILHHHGDTQTHRAVFDWEWDTAWEIKRLTSFGYVECNLEKWDWLEFKMLDQNDSDISSGYLQTISNWMMVEYKDLPYNN